MGSVLLWLLPRLGWELSVCYYKVYNFVLFFPPVLTGISQFLPVCNSCFHSISHAQDLYLSLSVRDLLLGASALTSLAWGLQVSQTLRGLLLFNYHFTLLLEWLLFLEHKILWWSLRMDQIVPPSPRIPIILQQRYFISMLSQIWFLHSNTFQNLSNKKWCHPQWASLSTSMNITKLMFLRHAKKSFSHDCRFCQVDNTKRHHDIVNSLSHPPQCPRHCPDMRSYQTLFPKPLPEQHSSHNLSPTRTPLHSFTLFFCS